MITRIIPLFLAAIAIGIFLSYVHPTYTGEVASLRAEIEGYDGALAAAAAFKEKGEAVRSAREAIPTDGRERIEAFLPDGVDNVQLILDLNALASRSGIRLADFNIQVDQKEEDKSNEALSPEGGVESLDVTVSGIGTYTAFRTFIEGVEWSLRPLDLIEVTVDSSETGVYTYAMTFRLYWLR